MAPETVTLPGLLDRTAERDGDRDAFVDGADRVTFAQLAEAADTAAGSLWDLGVRQGDVVCISLPSSIDFAVAYHAAMRLGAVTSAVNPRLGAAEVADIWHRTQPKVTLSLSGDPGLGGRWITPAALRADQRSSLGAGRRPALRRDQAVAVIWTSGTTGRPKGAVFDHRRLEAAADAMGDLSRRYDRRLASVPFAHTGFMGRVWDTARNAICEVIVPTPWKAAEALRLIEVERVTVCQGVPTQWSLMLAHPAIPDTDTSSLRAAATGAAASTPTLIAAIQDRLGCPVLVGYASTEAGTITRTRLTDPPEVAETTVGRPAHGVELEVVDDAGTPQPTGTVGAVRCRSSHVMVGYWRDEAATREVIAPDGWVTTGDLGLIDPAGNLRLVGRRKEMYIRGGYNVYPIEVEAALVEHPAVEAAAVVPAADPVLGEVGVAFVVSGQAIEPDELTAWCRSRLADYKAPDAICFLEELPVTPVGKVDKTALAPDAAAAATARTR